MTGRDRFTHSILTALGITLVISFAIFWFNPAHIPNNFAGIGHIADFLLFGLVTFTIWHPLMMEVFSWAIVARIKHKPSPEPPPGLNVAFVTTFVPSSESIELLYKTLPAMLAVDYPHDTWLLDEGNDPRVRALCSHLGVHHFSRSGKVHYNEAEGKFATKTKGGNHNSWYDSFGDNYDVVAQIDTDFIPVRSFLTKTLGYFRDPKVGFVGTPQVYGNTKESFIAKGAAEQTYSFYGPILRGFSGINTTLLIGANHILRVAALKSVDHYSAHLTEDLLTGMKLHAAGWKSVYVNEALAIGEGPSDWRSYFNQQMRWAHGCMDILFKHSPRLLRKMSVQQAVYYFFLQQHYFSGLAMIFGAVGLGLYFLLGLNTADIELELFAWIYVPLLLLCGLLARWVQRFNIRPQQERGWHLAGKVLSIAAWPVFFMALFGVMRGKKLTYKVTPKGKTKVGSAKLIPISLFKAHLMLGLFCLLCLVFGVLFMHRESPVMLFWLIALLTSLLLVPFAEILYGAYIFTGILLKNIVVGVYRQYRFFELRAHTSLILPSPVTDREKYRYVKRHHVLLMTLSALSFTALCISMVRFFAANPEMGPLICFFALTVIYFVVSFLVNVTTKNFDIRYHAALLTRWKDAPRPAIDVFLPTAGEPLDVLKNTWVGVHAMRQQYKGDIKVYCLDDSARPNVALLAREFGFIYESRPDRPHFKKAGNLRHGFKISHAPFIAIFDADFRPRHDFLDELLPYFYANKNVGIVQSPQFFDVRSEQNWLERGAGAVQELFYRYTQVSRRGRDAAICVGSNAIYRRAALDQIGGTALIEHSEDVHTGFNLRMKGWSVQYVPIVLAKGLCPSGMMAFFKQQYRWCLGSMSLLSSRKFWHTRLSFMSRLSYISGFLYYIHTAFASIFMPVLPLAILVLYPQHIGLATYIFIIPSIVFTQIIFPLWHKSTYGIEAWAVRMIYGWAHLFAVSDIISGNKMSWKPTGAKMKRDLRYISFRLLQFVFNFVPGVVWVGLAGWNMVHVDAWAFLPILLSGLYFLLAVAKVTFYAGRLAPAPRLPHGLKRKPA